MVAHTSMDEVSINILRDFVNDFMKYVEPFRSNRNILTSTRCRWLLTQHEKVFLKSYNYPGPQYHNVARTWYFRIFNSIRLHLRFRVFRYHFSTMCHFRHSIHYASITYVAGAFLIQSIVTSSRWSSKSPNCLWSPFSWMYLKASDGEDGFCNLKGDVGLINRGRGVHDEVDLLKRCGWIKGDERT